MFTTRLAAPILCATLMWTGLAAAQEVKHRVTGLFMPEREQDLREAVARIPDVKLVRVDYKFAEVTFEYEVAKFGKPEQAIQKLDGALRTVSSSTFGAKALSGVPKDKLELIEIKVAGCDCKACSLAAYESIFRLDGVERATASFREGRVTALVDPARIDRPALEAALKKKGIQVKSP